jgi:broad specificity phosphatase PhoE
MLALRIHTETPMRLFFGGLGMLMLTLLAAASGTAPSVPADGLLVVVVRHAEKAGDDPRDPGLSSAGERRALALAERLQGFALAEIYATPFRRTQLTAGPSAAARGLQVQVREFGSRDPDEDALQFREALLRSHRGEAVLVVGHSNTVPAIVEALAGAPAEAMPETEYDRLSIVRIAADGSAELTVERY